ncbi:MAG: hypothetical protein LBK99_06490 [Opitutaceae bacterium]|jgi:hypothetical protein|nr:hypothetical protein [Opitutaceae bacterium]
MTITEPITSLETVVPGGLATARMLTGRRYHSLSFETWLQVPPTEQKPSPALQLAPAEEVIDYIRNAVDAKDIRNLTCKRIRQINAANRHADPGHVVTQHLAEPWQEGYDAQVATAWSLYNNNNFTVYIKLKPQPAGTIVVIKGLQTYDTYVSQRYIGAPDASGQRTNPLIGAIKRSIPYNQAVAEARAAGTTYPWETLFPVIRQLAVTYGLSSGKNSIDGKDIGKSISRIWFFKTQDDATAANALGEVKIMADTVQIFMATRSEAKALLDRYGITLADEVPFLVCFDLNGDTEWMRARGSMLYDMTSPVGQSLDVVVEHLTNGFA